MAGVLDAAKIRRAEALGWRQQPCGTCVGQLPLLGEGMCRTCGGSGKVWRQRRVILNDTQLLDQLRYFS